MHSSAVQVPASPGTKPITPRSTAGPVVEDEEGDIPRLSTVAPATDGSAPGCLPPCVSSWEKSDSSPALPVEVLNGTKSFGDGQLTQMGP